MVSDPFIKNPGQTMRLLHGRFDKIFLASDAADRKVIFRKPK
jgi:hypothetical protein